MKRPPPIVFRPGEILAIDHRLAQLIEARRGRLEVEEAGSLAGRPVAAQAGRRSSGTSTAVISVTGLITQHLDFPPFVSSTERIKAELRSAIESPSVGPVVMMIDSPGGQIYGLQEVTSDIRQARTKKPILAAINPVAASAAYYIASGASQILITPSGEAGSVGVYQMHVDASKALETEGIKVTLLSRGEGKTWGNMYEALSPEARADIERSLDRYYSQFVADVAVGRGLPESRIRTGWGARCVGPREALAMGMVDGIAAFDEVLTLAARLTPSSAARMLHGPAPELTGQERARVRLAKMDAEERERRYALERLAALL